MKRKRNFLPRSLGVFFVASLLLIGLWFALRSLVADGFTQTINDGELQGFEISHGGLVVTGFPFFIHAKSQNISVHPPARTETNQANSWFIETQKTQLSSSTLTPLSWVLTHDGDMKIGRSGAQDNPLVYTITPAQMTAKIAVSFRGKLRKFKYAIEGASINEVVGTPPPITQISRFKSALTIKNGQGHVEAMGENIVLTNQIVGLLRPVLGNEISRIEIDAIIKNWPVLEDQGQEAWVQNGGRIVADHWKVQWGKADITGDFDLHFKDGLPKAIIHIKIKDASPLLEALIQANLIPAIYLRQINTLMSNIEPDEQGRKVLEFTLRDGAVKFGFITLFRID